MGIFIMENKFNFEDEYELLLPKRKLNGNCKRVKYKLDYRGCFNCTSHWTNVHGYCGIGYLQQHWLLSRFVYYNYNGEIPTGKVIRHTCDNPRCINPEHLIIGTQWDNVHDAVERGRLLGRNVGRGEKQGSSKLTEQKVLEIRKSSFSQTELSKIYSTSCTTISNIVNRKVWTHI